MRLEVPECQNENGLLLATKRQVLIFILIRHVQVGFTTVRQPIPQQLDRTRRLKFLQTARRKVNVIMHVALRFMQTLELHRRAVLKRDLLAQLERV